MQKTALLAVSSLNEIPISLLLVIPLEILQYMM